MIGAGPQLAHIPDDQLRRLEQLPTIGVNKTFYQLKLTYFLSAYIGEVILAAHRIPTSTLLHMRPVYEPPLIDGILPLRRELFDASTGLTTTLLPPEPTLFTKRNVALGATHLAYVMGAKRVVYIGVEQRNQVHFWHHMPAVKATIRQDVELLRDVPFLTIDHPYATYELQVDQMERPMSTFMKPFYEESHAESFREYFSILNEAGVEFVTTVKDSVVSDAGASYMELSELLA